MTQTCETCRWWNSGECRRYPPAMVPWPHDNQHPITYLPTPVFPTVWSDAWCGEWTEREQPQPSRPGPGEIPPPPATAPSIPVRR